MISNQIFLCHELVLSLLFVNNSSNQEARHHMSLSYRPPVRGSPLKRKFYHLGIERESRPPRDYEDETLPPSERISYVPRTFGPNEEEDRSRLTNFDATGEAPPKPHYLTDVDRARHFVHLLGGMDVAPHFANRPSFLLCRGGSLPMQHTELYKSVLSAQVRELGLVEQQLASSPLSSSSPSRRRLNKDTSPHQANINNSSGNSDAKEHEMQLDYLTSVDISAVRLSPSPSPDVCSHASTSMTRAGRLSSLEVALSSSKLHASSVVRHYRRLQEQRRELSELSRAHHPNQIITYVEN